MVATASAKTGAQKAPESKADEARAAGEKIEVLRAPASTILAALQKVSGAGRTSKSLPILAHVLIVKDGGRITFTSSDLEQQVSVEADLGGDTQAKACVTADIRKMTDILKSMPGDLMASMVSDGVKSTITAGRSRLTLASLDGQTFPMIKEDAPDGVVSLKQGTLKSMIDDVAYAMAAADIRYYLNGMLLEMDGTSLFAVATDGHRLAMSEALAETAMGKRSIILPRKVVAEMAKLLGDDASEVEVRLSQNQACLQIGDVKLVTKLIEGRFPDFRRVIPANLKHSITLSRDAFAHALRRAGLMTDDKCKGVRLQFKPGEMRLQAETRGETARELLEVDYDDEELEIGMNVHYLAEAVENMGCDQVTIRMTDGQTSILLTHANNPNFRSVVMPMRL